MFQEFEPDLNQLQIRSVEGSSRATSQTHGRLPRHVSLEELTSVLWCTDLWPASGPAWGQTWDLIYPLFAPISSAPFSSSHAFVHANALSLISVESTAFPLEGWWRIISHRCPDSTFLRTFFRTADTFYRKHVKKKSVNTNWRRELFSFFSQRLQCKLTWASIHQAVTRQINTHFHVSHLDSRRLTFSPKLMLARLETITLHSSVHMRWFTGLVHRCHWINNWRSLQTDLAWLTIHGGVYSSVIVCLQVSQVWARKRWGGGRVHFSFVYWIGRWLKCLMGKKKMTDGRIKKWLFCVCELSKLERQLLRWQPTN